MLLEQRLRGVCFLRHHRPSYTGPGGVGGGGTGNNTFSLSESVVQFPEIPDSRKLCEPKFCGGL